MHRVVQTRTGEDGNCFAACLASILDLPLEAVPEMSTDDQAERANDFLAGYGLSYRRAFIDGKKPDGYSTIEGISPRGGMHACVAHDGELLWDPHPIEDGTGQGLVEPRYYGLLESILGVTGKELKKHKSLGLDQAGFTCPDCGAAVERRYKNSTCQKCLEAKHQEYLKKFKVAKAKLTAVRGTPEYTKELAAFKAGGFHKKGWGVDQAGTMMQLRSNTKKQGGPFFIQETTESGAERTIPVKNLRRY